MSKVLRNFRGDFLFPKSINIIMNGCGLRIIRGAGPRISSQLQEHIIEKNQIFITTPLSDSVQEFIFAKLLDEPFDLLEEQVFPD